MSFHSFDIKGLANLLRQSDPNHVDSDDSEDEKDLTTLTSGSSQSKAGPGHIGGGARKEKGAGDGDLCTSSNPINCEDTSKKDIWAANEVLSKEAPQATIYIPNDPRKTPKYEMHYRQAVTTEDIFLQMGNKTPSSASCENLVVEIHLPDEEDFNKIQLNLKEQAIDLRSPNHFLYLGLPHPIDTKGGSAKWDPNTEKLIVTLKLIRDLDGINF